MYLSEEDINKIGFKSYGKNLKISDKAVFYRPERIELGNNIQIDDFCIIANNIKMHNNIHIAAGTYLLSSPNAFIELEDYTGVAFQSLILTSTDDYHGDFMTNATVPSKYKKRTEVPVILRKHSLIGMGSKIMPGVEIKEGTSVGAMSLVTKTTKPWKMYFGVPARIIGDRSKHLLDLEQEFLKEI